MNQRDESSHVPVMLKEALDILNVRPGLTWIDATAGAGGHIAGMLERTGESGSVFGIDRDIISLTALQETMAASKSGFPPNLKLLHANYADIEASLAGNGITTVDGGVLADLGVSSMQLDIPERGFSFLKEGPLDMRMDSTARTTASDLVNNLPEKELADLIFKYGEERLSRQIARRIVESRPLLTTLELSAVVSPVVERKRSRSQGKGQCHPATRTFQALRIAVNDELGSLAIFLRAAIKLLSPGARLAVITFHSLEDRLVKQIFREAASACLCPPRQPVCTCNKKSELKILTPKPLLPDASEVLANPRSRSAKLRAGEKVA